MALLGPPLSFVVSVMPLLALFSKALPRIIGHINDDVHRCAKCNSFLNYSHAFYGWVLNAAHIFGWLSSAMCLIPAQGFTSKNTLEFTQGFALH